MRSNVYIKVVVEHTKEEKAEDLGQELCRQILKNYAVRTAEVSSVADERDA
jgi:phosphoribosylformylglycinamidine (FGAM) synthase PurS component